MDNINDKIQLFKDRKIRTAWDEENEEWYFSITDVISVLTDSKDPTAYWRKLKQRLKAEGNETVTNCHGFRLLTNPPFSGGFVSNLTQHTDFKIRYAAFLFFCIVTG